MCGFGCGNESIIWIILLLCLCGGNNGNNFIGGCNDNNWIWILILLCCCGNGNQLNNCSPC
jgi:hypothetical protein